MAPQIPDAQVIENVKLVAADIGRQIDHQSDDAGSLDTKGGALFTLTATAGGLVAAHLHLDHSAEVWTALATAVVLGLLILCLLQTLRPRDGFHYGADPASMVRLVDTEDQVTVALSFADALVKARDLNVTYLATRQGWYLAALVLMGVGVAALVAMVQTGALQ